MLLLGTALEGDKFGCKFGIGIAPMAQLAPPPHGVKNSSFNTYKVYPWKFIFLLGENHHLGIRV